MNPKVTYTTCSHEDDYASSRLRKIAIITLATLSLCLFSVHAADPPAPPITITFLGDSLTAGYGLEKQQAFPALVAASLKAKGHQITCINAGVSGNTTAGGQRRLAWLLRAKPSILVVALGGNDGLRGVDPTASKKNLEAIILAARKKAPNMQLLLTGMKAPPNMGATYTKAFESIFSELAKKHDLPFVPFLLEGVAGHAEYNQPDGIHPNIAGHQKISSHLQGPIQKVLASLNKPSQ